MPPPKDPKIAKKSRISAGAAGAGGGTLLVLLAQNLSNDSPWKSWCLIAAPTVSVGLQEVYGWIAAIVKEWWEKKRLRTAISSTKASVKAGLENQSTSAAHKEKLRAQLEALERMDIDNQMRQVQALASHQPRTPDNRLQRTP